MALAKYEGPSLKLCPSQEDNEKKYLEFLLEIVNINPGIKLNILIKLLSEAPQELLDLYGRSKQSVKAFLKNHPDDFLCKDDKVYSVRSQNLFMRKLDNRKNDQVSLNLFSVRITNDQNPVQKEIYHLFEVPGVISAQFPTFGFIRTEFSSTVCVYFVGASFEDGKQHRLSDIKLKDGQKVYFNAKRSNTKVRANYQANYRAVLVWRPEEIEYLRNREKPAMYISEEINSDLISQWNEGLSESPVKSNFSCVYGAKGSVEQVFDDFGLIKWHNEEFVLFDINCLQTNQIPVFSIKKLLKPGQEVVFDVKATENQSTKWEATAVWLDQSDLRSQDSLLDLESDEMNTNFSSENSYCEVSFSDSHSVIETQENDIRDKYSSWENWEKLENQTGKIHPKIETEGIIIFGKDMTKKVRYLTEVVYIKGSQAQNLIRDVQDGTLVHFDAIKDKNICGGTWKASLVWIGKKPNLKIPNPLKDKTVLKKLEEKYLSRGIESCSFTPDVSEVLREKEIISLMSTTAVTKDVENKKTEVSKDKELDGRSTCIETDENIHSDKTCSLQRNCTLDVKQTCIYDNPAVRTNFKETSFKSTPIKNVFQSEVVEFSGEHAFNTLTDKNGHYTGSQCTYEVKTFTPCNKFSSESLKEVGLTSKMSSMNVVTYSMTVEDENTMNFSKPKIMQYLNCTGTVKLVSDYFVSVYFVKIKRCLSVFWTDLYVNRECASELSSTLNDILSVEDPIYFNYIEVLENYRKWGRIILAWIGKKPKNVDELDEEVIFNKFDSLSDLSKNNTLYDEKVKGMSVTDICTKKISSNSVSYETASESVRRVNSGHFFQQSSVSDLEVEVSLTPETESNSDLTALNTLGSGNDTKYISETPRTEKLSDSVKFIEVPETVSQLGFGSNSSTLHTLEKVNLDNVTTDLPLSSLESTNYDMLTVEPTRKIIPSTDSLTVTNYLSIRDSINEVSNIKNDSTERDMLKNGFSKTLNNTTDLITRKSLKEMMKTTTCSPTAEPLEQVTNTTTSLQVGKSSGRTEVLNTRSNLPSRDVVKEMRKFATSSSADVSLQQGTNNSATFLATDLLEKGRKPTTTSPTSDLLDKGTNTITVSVINSSEIKKTSSNSLTKNVLGEPKHMNTKLGLLCDKLSEKQIDIPIELPKVNLSNERSKTLLLILSNLEETREQVTPQGSLLKKDATSGSASDHPWFLRKDKDNCSDNIVGLFTSKVVQRVMEKLKPSGQLSRTSTCNITERKTCNQVQGLGKHDVAVQTENNCNICDKECQCEANGKIFFSRIYIE
ncbi:uncharacterized protein LOC143226452 isoform X2 [Tachypleus tridentatus]|uniref:uncharacterized protein LOC143226452 isoform X2 n=1 Tax=Tachypleus tridentatus TaxID=6853 RepID=UPI003FCF44FC